MRKLASETNGCAGETVGVMVMSFVAKLVSSAKILSDMLWPWCDVLSQFDIRFYVSQKSVCVCLKRVFDSGYVQSPTSVIFEVFVRIDAMRDVFPF